MRKRSGLLSVAIIVGSLLLISLVLYRRASRVSPATQHVSSTDIRVSANAHPQSQAQHTRARQQNAPEPQQQHDAPRSVENLEDPQYNHAVARYAAQHPELRLSTAEINTLQQLLSKARNDRYRYEVSIARIESVNDRETLITIPPYKEKCDEILASLNDGVSTALDAFRAKEMSNVLDSALNAAMADYDQTLLITRDPNDDNVFKVVQSCVKQDAATGAVTRSTGISYLRPGSYGTFSMQKEFLPLDPRAGNIQ